MEKIPDNNTGLSQAENFNSVKETSNVETPEATEESMLGGPVIDVESEVIPEGSENNEGEESLPGEDMENSPTEEEDGVSEERIAEQEAQDEENIERVRAELQETEASPEGGDEENLIRRTEYTRSTTTRTNIGILGGMGMMGGGASHERKVNLKMCEKCKGSGKALWIFKYGVCKGSGRVPSSVSQKQTQF
ncbi:MAG: hypothetical protein WDZ88_00450 [Candidatus Paceibacterota bacterium]